MIRPALKYRLMGMAIGAALCVAAIAAIYNMINWSIT
jgi:hypothetical protein